MPCRSEAQPRQPAGPEPCRAPGQGGRGVMQAGQSRTGGVPPWQQRMLRGHETWDG